MKQNTHQSIRRAKCHSPPRRRPPSRSHSLSSAIAVRSAPVQRSRSRQPSRRTLSSQSHHHSHSSSPSTPQTQHPQRKRLMRSPTPISSFSYPTSCDVFHSSTPNAFVSRLLLAGAIGGGIFVNHFWKKQNDAFFESMERHEIETNKKLQQEHDAVLKKRFPNLYPSNHVPTSAADKLLFSNASQAAGLDRDVQAQRDEDALRPKLQPEFAIEPILYADDEVANRRMGNLEALVDGFEKTDNQNSEEYRAQREQEIIIALCQKFNEFVNPNSSFPETQNFDLAYAVLGLTKNACKEEIDERYRVLMRLNHPDQGGSPFLARQISSAREKVYQMARSDPTYKKQVFDDIQAEHDMRDRYYREDIEKRLNVIQRRREIMEFRKSQWGTPNMNRELMVVENEASRRVHNLDFGILQMNRGQWPSIVFNGWKPRAFRTQAENDRWKEYKEIKDELTKAPFRREIEQYNLLQNQDWEIIKHNQRQQKLRWQKFVQNPSAVTFKGRSAWEQFQDNRWWTYEGAQQNKRERDFKHQAFAPAYYGQSKMKVNNSDVEEEAWHMYQRDGDVRSRWSKWSPR